MFYAASIWLFFVLFSSFTKSTVPGPSAMKNQLVEDNDYDVLPSRVQPADDNDYDVLPPAKKPPPKNPGA